MDGIHNIAGRREVKLTIGETEYTLQPMILSEYAEKERYILDRQPSPLKALAELPDDLRTSDLIDKALRQAQRARFVSMEEEAEFDESLHGIAWRLWRAVRTNHPEIDGVQAALDLIEQCIDGKQAELLAALENQVTPAVMESEEKDILGNSDGRPTSRPTETPSENWATSDGLGHNSTADWLTVTDGDSTTSTI